MAHLSETSLFCRSRSLSLAQTIISSGLIVSTIAPAAQAAISPPLVSNIAVSGAIATPQFSQPATATPQLAQAIAPAEDGTGTVVTQTGDTFDITGGTLAGENLFHSFEQFGLSAEQTANILAGPQIENVLGRVTGGDPSVINGLLQLTGGDANLFLINPQGIIFGPQSQVLVPAAFTATTADAVQFDEEWFLAVGSNDYAALVGSPTGFAFADDGAGVIVNAGDLTSLSGDSVMLLGGTVINTGTIETPGGTVTIAAVPGENWVRISQEGSLLSLELPTQDPAFFNANAALEASDLPALLTGGTVPEGLGVAIADGVVTLTDTNTAIPTSAGTAIASGTLNAADTSASGTGGAIDVVGDRVGLVNAMLDVSGTSSGGQIRVGGDYQGQRKKHLSNCAATSPA